MVLTGNSRRVAQGMGRAVRAGSWARGLCASSPSPFLMFEGGVSSPVRSEASPPASPVSVFMDCVLDQQAGIDLLSRELQFCIFLSSSCVGVAITPPSPWVCPAASPHPLLLPQAGHGALWPCWGEAPTDQSPCLAFRFGLVQSLGSALLLFLWEQ